MEQETCWKRNDVDNMVKWKECKYLRYKSKLKLLNDQLAALKFINLRDMEELEYL